MPSTAHLTTEEHRDNNGTFSAEVRAPLISRRGATHASHHRSKNVAKINVGNTARKSLARESASRQLFCCATTIMASASLNFDFFSYRSPHHGSKIWQKSSRRGAAQELFCSASDEVRALLISRRGATPVSPRSKNVAKIHVRDAARASLAQWSASRPDLLQC